MKWVIVFLIGVLAASFTISARSKPKGITHIWVMGQDSAVEIYDYTILKCVPNPNTYCSYWTTIGFSVHSMPDSVFLTLVNAGYFTGQDYNRRYIP